MLVLESRPFRFSGSRRREGYESSYWGELRSNACGNLLQYPRGGGGGREGS